MRDEFEVSVEQYVVGALLQIPDQSLVASLSGDMFETRQMREAFLAITDLVRTTGDYNALAVARQLVYERGWSSYDAEFLLSLLYQNQIAPEDIISEFRAIAAKRIELSKKSTEFETLKRTDPRAFVADSDVKNSVDASHAMLEAMNRTAENRWATINTGFRDIDSMCPTGLPRGGCSIIAARTSMGKSALALRIAQKVTQSGGSVLFFSLESRVEDVAMRYVSMQTRIPASELRRVKRLSNEEWAKLQEELNAFALNRFFVFDGSYLTTRKVDGLISSTRSMARGDIDLVVVDYLGLMSAEDGVRKPRHEEISSISRELKLIASKYNVAMLLVCQINRMTEGRKDKRPTLADLRDSGAIEQDADIVMLLYRDGYYHKNADDSIAELAIAKNRDGSTGAMRLKWTSHILLFSDDEGD